MKTNFGIGMLLMATMTVVPALADQSRAVTDGIDYLKRDVGAKGIFYRPVGNEADGRRVLAMRHRIVAARGEQVGFVPEKFTFVSGDRMRLQVSLNRTGHMYVLHRGSMGDWKLLFPDPRIDNGMNSITAGQAIEIPKDGWFEFDTNPGIEELYLFFAIEPIRELTIPEPGEPLKDVHISFAASVVENLIGRHESQLKNGQTKGIYWTDTQKAKTRHDDDDKSQSAAADYTASIINVADGVVCRKIALRHESR